MSLVENENSQNNIEETKQKLFTIATIAYKLWEMVNDDANLNKDFALKVSQYETGLMSLIKNYMSDDENKNKFKDINYDDLVIGN